MFKSRRWDGWDITFVQGRGIGTIYKTEFENLKEKKNTWMYRRTRVDNIKRDFRNRIRGRDMNSS
jgi:hypothetical protein